MDIGMRTFQRYVSGVFQIVGLIFLAGFIASPSAFSAHTVLVSTGAVWRYFDAGMAPSAGWQNPGFVDSAWLVGPGEFGFGDGDEATTINSVTTAYFRRTFTVDNPSDVTSLFVDVYRDDGVIVYLNGVEVLRDNMPPGAVSYSTTAEGSALDDGEFPVRGNISPGLLVAGINTLAAELHQSSSSRTDLTFDLTLVADTVDRNQAPTANSQSAVVVQNTPTPITLSGSDPEANPLTYIITSSPTHGTLSGTAPNVTYTPALNYVGPDSFTFKVNDGALDSADATVSIQVLAPPDPPEIVAAIGDCGGTEVIVFFNEPADRTTATALANYLVADSSGNALPITSASLGADQQTVTLVLGAPLDPARTYLLRAMSICDLSGDCLLQQIVPIELASEPPVLACAVAVSNLWPPNHEMVDVGLSGASSAGNLDVQVFSNEPDSESVDAQFADGVLTIRAQREGKLSGRVYLIVVTSTDECGHSVRCCITVVAPHDSSQAALNEVNAIAAAAQAECSPTGSALTPFPLLP
jgi:Big-like domain-containing protein